MKKLFFVAALATVAISGAFATNAKFQSGNFYTVNSSVINITCPDGTATCDLKYPGVTAYNAPVGTPGRHTVDLSQFNYQP